MDLTRVLRWRVTWILKEAPESQGESNAEIRKVFRGLPDPRAANAFHDLLDIIVIALAATLLDLLSHMRSLTQKPWRPGNAFSWNQSTSKTRSDWPCLRGLVSGPAQSSTLRMTAANLVDSLGGGSLIQRRFRQQA